MVDQLLDQHKFPAWQGERIPMVRQWSSRHEDLWLGKYRELRNTFNKDTVGDQARAHRDANAFYAANQADMDAGCLVSWQSCFDPEAETNAIQHAYNALIDDGDDVFASEFQQKPLANAAQSAAIASDDVRSKIVNIPRWIVPAGLETLTAFCDVQEKLLYWAVVAWGPQLHASRRQKNDGQGGRRGLARGRHPRRARPGGYRNTRPGVFSRNRRCRIAGKPNVHRRQLGTDGGRRARLCQA
jgi:hypothetical protein